MTLMTEEEMRATALSMAMRTLRAGKLNGIADPEMICGVAQVYLSFLAARTTHAPPIAAADIKAMQEIAEAKRHFTPLAASRSGPPVY